VFLILFDTVYIHIKHRGLEQCNGNPVLDIKSCNGGKGRVDLSFCWDAFDIERMIEEKIVSTSFGRAAGHGKRALGAGDAHVRTPGASAAQPLRGTNRAPPGA
jgi:hypothetical protein